MRCVIIAGSPETNAEFIKKTVKSDDYVICADKGYAYAKYAGISPNLVVGDFDSYKEEITTDCEVITLIPHKDDTDTIHSIDVAFEKGYHEFVILGALGGRIDHSFANISALEYINSMGGKGILLSEKERVEFLTVGEHNYRNLCGKTFSVFPFGCEKTCVSEIGAEYSIERYDIKSRYPIGVSNVFTSDDAWINIYDGNAILIINLSEDFL